MSKKGMTNHGRSCQSFSFILKPDYFYLKNGYKDESACLWKQLKWIKFFSEKIIHGITIADSVSEKIT